MIVIWNMDCMLTSGFQYPNLIQVKKDQEVSESSASTIFSTYICEDIIVDLLGIDLVIVIWNMDC